MYIFIKELKKDEELINTSNLPDFIKKIILKFVKLLNITTIQKIDKNHLLYIIPKVKNINTIKKITKQNGNNIIILSKNLKTYENQLEIKKTNKIKYHIYNIIEYIMKTMEISLQMQNIYVLTNEFNEENLLILTNLINKVKTLTIVTENVKRFNLLEDKMYTERGYLLTVTNNKNKAIKNAFFIVNLDYTNEALNKYKINRNSIIINASNEKLNILYFQGLIINDIEIRIKNTYNYSFLYDDFDNVELYDSFNSYYSKRYKIIEEYMENNIEIMNIIGNNGKINTKELLNMKKNLDKSKKLE